MTSAEGNERLTELAALLQRAGGSTTARLEAAEIERLLDLFRWASSRLARLRTEGQSEAELARWSSTLARAHSLIHRGLGAERGSLVRRSLRLLAVDAPRAILAERRLLLWVLAAFYGLALLAFVAVRMDLELAFSFAAAEMVTHEIEGLSALGPGEEFRGNFTFGLGESPSTSGWIFGHNLFVAILFFASGLVPPLFVLFLVLNACMVGAYTAVAAHWGQALSISSILWCHGAFELQMIVLAAAAGLVLAQSLLAPGPWSRTRALELARPRAIALFAPVPLFLFAAGMIEGFVSPHAPLGLRLAVTGASLALLAAWLAAHGAVERRWFSAP